MSKVIFVGDVHLKPSSPISRKDDYSESMLSKLRAVADYALSVGAPTIIMLGDIFDSTNTSVSYLSRCMDVFNDIRKRGVSLFSIIGNHDIKNERLDSLSGTPLGVLVKSQCVGVFNSLTVGKTRIVAHHYSAPLEANLCDASSVLVSHSFFNQSFSDSSLSEHDLTALGYGAYVFGHDHVPYDSVEGDGWVLLRPGSLCRNTSHFYNLYRKPRVLVLDVDDFSFSYWEVPCESDVFHVKKSEVSVSDMSNLVEHIRNSYTGSEFDIRGFIEKLEVSVSAKSLLLDYCKILGA